MPEGQAYGYLIFPRSRRLELEIKFFNSHSNSLALRKDCLYNRLVDEGTTELIKLVTEIVILVTALANLKGAKLALMKGGRKKATKQHNARKG